MSTLQTQVLVVGAGPTGLAAALALARLGVSVRVIDKSTARSDRSKALGVQAGTLECLEKAIGPELARKFVASGQPAREAWIHLNDQAPIKIDFSSIPSAYGFILILPQSETERLLEEELSRFSVRVERRTELHALEQSDSQVTSTLQDSNGKTETVTSDFLIGGDGAHSMVRRALDIPFKGGAYTGHFILGDVTLSWPWPYGSVQTFVSERGVIASFPMGERRYRLILIPKGLASSSESLEISPEEFKAVVESLSRGAIHVERTDWLTRFRVHHRIVAHFQKGRVFLAGDAAHIHSPAGGQGMNTGIQDALNLAFKLKRVLSKEAPPRILENYERERLPVARGVLRGTDLVFRMALLPENPGVGIIRRLILPRLVGSKFFQRRIARAISEVSIARREVAGYSSQPETKTRG